MKQLQERNIFKHACLIYHKIQKFNYVYSFSRMKLFADNYRCRCSQELLHTYLIYHETITRKKHYPLSPPLNILDITIKTRNQLRRSTMPQRALRTDTQIYKDTQIQACVRYRRYEDVGYVMFLTF